MGPPLVAAGMTNEYACPFCLCMESGTITGPAGHALVNALFSPLKTTLFCRNGTFLVSDIQIVFFRFVKGVALKQSHSLNFYPLQMTFMKGNNKYQMCWLLLFFFSNVITCAFECEIYYMFPLVLHIIIVITTTIII